MKDRSFHGEPGRGAGVGAGRAGRAAGWLLGAWVGGRDGVGGRRLQREWGKAGLVRL